MSDPAEVLRLEPADLDGHTVDELSDYLEAGCEPADPSIDGSPSCRIALAALQRLHALAGDHLDAVGSERRSPRDWVASVLASIPVDARPGRSFPIGSDDPRVAATITEGAIRGLVRAVGDEVPGLLVGSVRIGTGEPASLSIEVALVHGASLPEATRALRAALRPALLEHLPFEVERIDIAVVGLIRLPPETAERS